MQEQVLAYRERWFALRLRKEKEVNMQRLQLTLPLGEYRLIKNEQGLIDALTLQEEMQALVPDVDEVILTPHAVGLNFRDVLNAMNLYPGDAGPLGGDCAGVITAVGSQVKGLQVGEEVFGIAYGSLASVAISKAALLVKKPKTITMEAAATIPTVFLTAYYTLIEVANLQAGETILIHAGTGGVGLASIQIARMQGARIIVSAGSTEKHNYLKELGITEIVSSRQVSFAEEIARLTAGRGVDVVLNMLSGEGFVEASVNSTGIGGRFIEIGKRGIWSVDKMAQLRPDIHYTIVALDEIMRDKPNYIHELLEKIQKLLQQGKCHALPQQVFPITHSIDAFKFLQQARQIGKVVISIPPSALKFDNSGVYWITGGLGGLGLVVGRYLLNHGVKHIVLTNRHAESNAAHDEIKAWRAQGCRVDVILVDISDKNQLNAAWTQLRSDKPLRGIFHLAGMIEDAPFMRQTSESFVHAFAGKVQGAWNLHELTQENGIKLDYFVLFSSIASILGSPGQSNYASANSFLDGLAHYRQQQGLVATSINWGPWAEVGMAKNLMETHQRQGLSALSTAQGMFLWEAVLKQGSAQCAILKIDWGKMRNVVTHTPSWLQELVEQQPLSSFVQELQQVPVEQQVSVLKAVIRQELNKVLGRVNQEEIDDKKNFFELGMDSLRSAELINRLQAKVGNTYTLSFSEVAQLQNIEDLTQHLAAILLNTQALAVSVSTVSPNNYAEYIRFDTYPNYQQILKLSQHADNQGLKHLLFESNDSIAKDIIVIKRKKYINFSSYNYLGFSGHPEINKTVMQAVRKYGTSVSASRLVSGQKPIHTQLETAIATLIGVPSALVMSAGHATNVTTISHLMGKKDLIIHDSLAHNSLFQGAVFSGAMRLTFSHNNLNELKELLTQYRHQYERILIIAEGVYSMDGDIPNLPELIAIKKEFSTFLMIDEAHSMGTIGATGRGIREYYAVDPADVDIWMGTLSKSFASCGGYIAGCTELVDYLKFSAPGFVYSCGISPANTAAALKSIQLLAQYPERVVQLQTNTRFLLEKLQNADINVGMSKDSPIIPIIVQQSARALQLCTILRQHNIYAHPILAPAVEEGKARVRLFVSCLHTMEELNYTADVLINTMRTL